NLLRIILSPKRLLQSCPECWRSERGLISLHGKDTNDSSSEMIRRVGAQSNGHAENLELSRVIGSRRLGEKNSLCGSLVLLLVHAMPAGAEHGPEGRAPSGPPWRRTIGEIQWACI